MKNFAEKEKCPNLGPKIPYLGIFGLEFQTMSYLKSAPSNLSNGKTFQKKQKCLNLGLNISSLDIFGQEFKKKPIAIFEINTLKFAYLQNFTKKQKCLNLIQKIPDLGVFGLQF